jgi:hypothetical protein
MGTKRRWGSGAGRFRDSPKTVAGARAVAHCPVPAGSGKRLEANRAQNQKAQRGW